MSTRWRLAVLAGMFALVSACGAGGDGGDGVASVSTPNSSAADEPGGDEPRDAKADADKMRQYAKCMREHGVDMPDPKIDKDGGVMMQASPMKEGDRDKVTKADEACKKYMPNGGEPPKPTAKDIDNMRKQAKCLRDRGYDVPDPTMEKPYLQLDQTTANGEKFRKDMEECGDGNGMISVHVGEGEDGKGGGGTGGGK